MSISKERLLELTKLYLTAGQAEMVNIALANQNILVASASVAGAISGLRKAAEISDELAIALSEELGHPILVRDATHQGSSKLQ